MCLGTKSKNTTTTKQKLKHKTIAGAGIEPAPKAGALPMHHRVN